MRPPSFPTCVEIKILRRVHAIDATPARRRGGAGSSPLDRISTAAVRPTHWLISTQPLALVVGVVDLRRRPHTAARRLGALRVRDLLRWGVRFGDAAMAWSAGSHSDAIDATRHSRDTRQPRHITKDAEHKPAPPTRRPPRRPSRPAPRRTGPE